MIWFSLHVLEWIINIFYICIVIFIIIGGEWICLFIRIKDYFSWVSLFLLFDSIIIIHIYIIILILLPLLFPLLLLLLLFSISITPIINPVLFLEHLHNILLTIHKYTYTSFLSLLSSLTRLYQSYLYTYTYISVCMYVNTDCM